MAALLELTISLVDPVLECASIRPSRGRGWWAHLKFTRINIEADFPERRDQGRAARLTGQLWAVW